MRGWPAVFVIVLLSAFVVLPATFLVFPATPAGAEPGCAPGGPPAEQFTGVPWPQARYAPRRLAGIADGSGVTVAVIDSGVDAAHPLLAGAVLRGEDLLDRTGTGQRDCVGHGTAVASIIAGTSLDGIVVGLAPGARVLPFRVSEQEIVDGHPSGNPGTAAGVAKAIHDAIDRGAQVINLSLVMPDHPAVRASVEYALAHDVVVVAAVGNAHRDGGLDPVPYPAGYPGVLGVGAIDEYGNRVSSSQAGPYVDLVAPGSAVIGAARGRGLAHFDGTSFAVPFVSATAALIRQYHPDLSATAVAARILATTDPAPGGSYSESYGYGILNPYRAVTDQLGPAPALVTDSPRPRPRPRHSVDVQAATAGLATAGLGTAGLGTAAMLALASLLLAGLVGLAAIVLPRGAARHWRAGRT